MRQVAAPQAVGDDQVSLRQLRQRARRAVYSGSDNDCLDLSGELTR